MADNPNALRVAADGGKCYIAPIGTPAPVGLAAFGAGWLDLGLISEEGVTESQEEERSEKRPWGYKSPARTDITESTKAFALTCWETNAFTRALYDNVPLADIQSMAGGVVHIPVKRATGQRLYQVAIDAFDGTNHLRTIVPKAEITERGEQINNAEEVIGYNFTWQAYELSDKTMFDRYILSDGMWVPVETLELTGTATVAVAATTPLVATAGYFNDDEDADVSADSVWDTSDPAKATVSQAGVVTGVAAGSAVITAMYRGVIDTLTVTVTA